MSVASWFFAILSAVAAAVAGYYIVAMGGWPPVSQFACAISLGFLALAACHWVAEKSVPRCPQCGREDCGRLISGFEGNRTGCPSPRK